MRYIKIEVMGGGASMGPFPLSADYVVVRTSWAGNMGRKVYEGYSYGGMLGAAVCGTPRYEIPPELDEQLPADLMGWSIRVAFKDAVLLSAYSNVEVTFYSPEGIGLPSFERRLKCGGFLSGSVEIDAALQRGTNAVMSKIDEIKNSLFAPLETMQRQTGQY